MSTMREQFEAWAKIPIWWRNGETYDDLHTAQAWAAWQAATEAAKATGTAGEMSESQKIAMQYGQQLNNAEAAAFVSGIELGKELAARQPAPVAKVLTDEEIDVLWSDVLTINPLPQPAYRALVRAALAARSQP